MKKISITIFLITLFVVLLSACAESKSTPAPMSSPPVLQQVVPSPTAKAVNKVNTRAVSKPISTKSKKTVITTPEPTVIHKATPTANETEGKQTKAENITSNPYNGSTKTGIKSTEEEVIHQQNKIAQDAAVCYGAEGLLGAICESGMKTLKSNPMICMQTEEEWLASLCAREAKNPSVQAMAGSMMQAMKSGSMDTSSGSGAMMAEMMQAGSQEEAKAQMPDYMSAMMGSMMGGQTGGMSSMMGAGGGMSSMMGAGGGMSSMGGGGGATTSSEPTGPTVDLSNLPKFVTNNFIDLDPFNSITKFRGAYGHDYSATDEEYDPTGKSCRSMKHYFEAYTLDQRWAGQFGSYDTKGNVNYYAPTAGKIIDVVHGTFGRDNGSEGEEWQFTIESSEYPSVNIKFHHVNLEKHLQGGGNVQAGEFLGTIARDNGQGEIAAYVLLGKGTLKYVSFFELITDDIFALYESRGLKNRSDVIISREDRESNPIPCTIGDGQGGKFYSLTVDEQQFGKWQQGSENWVSLTP
ncbi:MAG: hypothetical protein CL715_04190 [Chloroflexi bacterium]|nr:hypothetical protein [Chloroflexota bacterium]